MRMSLFNDCQIALDLGISVGFKKKVELRKTIIEHGGIVSYIVTKKVSYLTKYYTKQRSIGKHAMNFRNLFAFAV